MIFPYPKRIQPSLCHAVDAAAQQQLGRLLVHDHGLLERTSTVVVLVHVAAAGSAVVVGAYY